MHFTLDNPIFSSDYFEIIRTNVRFSESEIYKKALQMHPFFEKLRSED